MMECMVTEEPLSALEAYGRVPIAFEVARVFELSVMDGGFGGLRLTERAVDTPYVKDYGTARGEGPTRWAKRWDISNWGLLSAFVDDVRIGGCVIAYDTVGVDRLEGRNDVAALWEIRVRPEYRRMGVGSRLFEGAVGWAAQRACRYLKVETQNINAPACRFYAKQGCVLGTINRFAYREYPDEVELIWYKWIERTAPGSRRGVDQVD